MSAGIELYNNVLNQLGSPALYSDIFANRPAFGYTGRLFISTDTLEIYRDTGTAWQLLSSGGGGTNIYNSNGTLTANRTLTNGGFSLTFTGAASSFVFNLDANTNVSRQLNFTTGSVKRWSTEITDNETGANAGSNYYLRSFQDGGTSLLDVLSITRSTGVVSHNSEAVLSTAIDNLTGIYNVNRGTYTSATYTGGNPQNAIYNIFTHDARINQTYGNGQYIAAAANVWRFEPTDSYTLTLTQATGVRTMGAALYGNQYNIPVGKTETVTHLSGITLLGIYDLFTGGRGTLAVTNAYGLVINDLNEYAYGTLTLTNRWGIYQGGASDSNYFNGNTLIGSTTSTGEKLQVTGTARVTQSAYFATASGNVGIGTASPGAKATILDGSATNIGGLSGNNSFSGISFTSSPSAILAASFNILGNGTDLVFNRVTGGNIYFRENNNNQVTILNGGNVGIGTTTNGGYKLRIEGGGSIMQLVSTTAASEIRFQNSVNANGFISYNNSDLLFYANTGSTSMANFYGATNAIGVLSGTAPSASVTDRFLLYSADITAGNAAAHFRTENGAIVKIYQETTGVGTATYASPGGGNTVKTDDTFDGYTLQQVVKALRNLGILA